jgi:hypothetical protein
MMLMCLVASATEKFGPAGGSIPKRTCAGHLKRRLGGWLLRGWRRLVVYEAPGVQKGPHTLHRIRIALHGICLVLTLQRVTL